MIVVSSSAISPEITLVIIICFLFPPFLSNLSILSCYALIVFVRSAKVAVIFSLSFVAAFLSSLIMAAMSFSSLSSSGA